MTEVFVLDVLDRDAKDAVLASEAAHVAGSMDAVTSTDARLVAHQPSARYFRLA